VAESITLISTAPQMRKTIKALEERVLKLEEMLNKRA